MVPLIAFTESFARGRKVCDSGTSRSSFTLAMNFAAVLGKNSQAYFATSYLPEAPESFNASSTACPDVFSGHADPGAESKASGVTSNVPPPDPYQTWQCQPR